MGMCCQIGRKKLETTYHIGVESIYWYLLLHGPTKATKQEIVLAQGGINFSLFYHHKTHEPG